MSLSAPNDPLSMILTTCFIFIKKKVHKLPLTLHMRSLHFFFALFMSIFINIMPSMDVLQHISDLELNFSFSQTILFFAPLFVDLFFFFFATQAFAPSWIDFSPFSFSFDRYTLIKKEGERSSWIISNLQVDFYLGREIPLMSLRCVRSPH